MTSLLVSIPYIMEEIATTRRYTRAALLAILAAVCLPVLAADITLAPSKTGALTAWHASGPFPEPVQPVSFLRANLPRAGEYGISMSQEIAASETIGRLVWVAKGAGLGDAPDNRARGIFNI